MAAPERPGQNAQGIRLPGVLPLDYARLKRKDETLHFLESAFQERSPEMPFLQKRPNYGFLHSDPRYQARVKRMGLRPN